MDINEYIEQHIEPEGDYLYRLWRATNVHLLHGRMASGHLQGRLLKMLVTMLRPVNILEVGTFSGYSAICLAEGLAELSADDAASGISRKVWTFEINDEQEDFTRPWLTTSISASAMPSPKLRGWASRSTWRSSTATSAHIWRPTKP